MEFKIEWEIEKSEINRNLDWQRGDFFDKDYIRGKGMMIFRRIIDNRDLNIDMFSD